jgi:F-type H+-transporting ATPase subunit b
MSSSLNIYPFESTEGVIRFVLQIVIFSVGLFLANKLIIKPALRLHNERMRRTSGSSENAKKEMEHANQLEHDYFANLKKGADEAKTLRLQEIKKAQSNANKLILENQEKANQFVQNVKSQIAVEMTEAKKQLPNQLDEVMSIIQNKIGLTAIIAISLAGTLYHSIASAETGDLIQSFWYSIFWPYFQFAIFIAAIVYFAKKPIVNMLSNRRDDLRSRLSEAHEAVALADRKVHEYKSKINSLEKEITELKNQHLQDAKIESEKILLDAQKASESILRDSERAAKELITQSKEEIRKELFSIALDEFEKRLTPEALFTLSKKLKDDALDSVKSIH